MPNYLASLIDSGTGENTLTINSGCDVFTYTDTSNYDLSDQDGHLRADFTDYRRVEITTGDGTTQWIQSSINGADVDEIIPTASTTNDTINFSLREDIDEDGIYRVFMCNYPTWNNAVAYNADEVTFYNGILYKALGTTTAGQTPNVTPAEWEEYAPTEEEALLTPYCTQEMVLILCRKILKCNEELIHQAFCLMDSDFCNDDVLCKNRTFLNATKMDLLIKAAQISVNRQAWNEVQNQVNLMKSICNCK